MPSEGHLPAHLGRFLKGLKFPATQRDLVDCARQNSADQGVLDVLGNMPKRQYESMADIMKLYRQIQ
jgi:hypothetical protein